MEPYEGFLVNQVLDAHWGILDDEDVSVSSFLLIITAWTYVNLLGNL